MAFAEGSSTGGEKCQDPSPASDSVRLAAMKFVTSSAIPGAAAALVKLNVFEVLAEDGGELTAAEIAAKALPGNKTVSVAYLGRLLRMMSAISGQRPVRESVAMAADGVTVSERRYSLEPMGRYLVNDNEKGSFVNMLLAGQMPAFLNTWEHLHESVLDDSVPPFARAHGGLNAWEYGKQTPEFDKVFNKALAGQSKVYLRAILDGYHGFDDVKVLVDVGGGFGSALSIITARYPHIRGINFDQPHVINACPEIPRVELVGGSFFDSVPNDGDAIFMKHILHDWDDESCIKILKNCFKALPAHGKVISLDNLLPEIIKFEGGDFMALQADICMLAFNHSGARERTEGDYLKLGLDAGFRFAKVVCRVDHISVCEFHK